jgi:hypothetical protein
MKMSGSLLWTAVMPEDVMVVLPSTPAPTTCSADTRGDSDVP